MISSSFLLHVSVTSFFPMKNLALHPPQKSATQTASGWAGQVANMQGSTKQETRGLSGGQVGGGGGSVVGSAA